MDLETLRREWSDLQRVRMNTGEFIAGKSDGLTTIRNWARHHHKIVDPAYSYTEREKRMSQLAMVIVIAMDEGMDRAMLWKLANG